MCGGSVTTSLRFLEGRIHHETDVPRLLRRRCSQNLSRRHNHYQRFHHSKVQAKAVLHVLQQSALLFHIFVLPVCIIRVFAFFY